MVIRVVIRGIGARVVCGFFGLEGWGLGFVLYVVGSEAWDAVRAGFWVGFASVGGSPPAPGGEEGGGTSDFL